MEKERPWARPWANEEFVDFMYDMNKLATEKYGWSVSGYSFENEEYLELILMPVIDKDGRDSENRKF